MARGSIQRPLAPKRHGSASALEAGGLPATAILPNAMSGGAADHGGRRVVR